MSRIVLLISLAVLFSKGLAAHFHVDPNFATKPSPEVGERMRNYDRSVNKTYAFELGIDYYYQGDIILRPSAQQNAISLMKKPDGKWPNAEVPYKIIGSFTRHQLANISTAMEQFADTTCIRFVKRTNEDIYVKIDSSDTGCWSNVGRASKDDNTVVNLGSKCFETGTVVHELMHALGFYHEFVRPDRDDYIWIDRSALKPKLDTDKWYAVNLAKMSYDEVELFGIPYYYGSVMHYSRYLGAESYDKPVMDNLTYWDRPDFGNDTGLSDPDILALNYMYCNSSTTLAPTTTAASTKKAKTTTTTTSATTKKPKTTTTTTGSTTAAPTTTNAPITTTTTKATPTTKSPNTTQIFHRSVQCNGSCIITLTIDSVPVA
ncbi:zinc metalloproteinase nas-14-like [Malaya genurostris]|uniref:zinc metalloproteinase nas-14-like n=1 Tax=Malaya genurostris TaxID=325434 RepID=UPI0026F3D045|nr:zinc metalloproteinase nas-14-like [Malaya genurostris]